MWFTVWSYYVGVFEGHPVLVERVVLPEDGEKWRVRAGVNTLCTDGVWAMEGLPSDHDVRFERLFRFTSLDQAMSAALHALGKENFFSTGS